MTSKEHEKKRTWLLPLFAKVYALVFADIKKEQDKKLCPIKYFCMIAKKSLKCPLNLSVIYGGRHSNGLLSSYRTE